MKNTREIVVFPESKTLTTVLENGITVVSTETIGGECFVEMTLHHGYFPGEWDKSRYAEMLDWILRESFYDLVDIDDSIDKVFEGPSWTKDSVCLKVGGRRDEVLYWLETTIELLRKPVITTAGFYRAIDAYWKYKHWDRIDNRNTKPTKQEIEAFVSEICVGSNIIISSVGDISHKKLCKAVKRILGDLKWYGSEKTPYPTDCGTPKHCEGYDKVDCKGFSDWYAFPTEGYMRFKQLTEGEEDGRIAIRGRHIDEGVNPVPFRLVIEILKTKSRLLVDFYGYSRTLGMGVVDPLMITLDTTPYSIQLTMEITEIDERHVACGLGILRHIVDLLGRGETITVDNLDDAKLTLTSSIRKSYANPAFLVWRQSQDVIRHNRVRSLKEVTEAINNSSLEEVKRAAEILSSLKYDVAVEGQHPIPLPAGW